MIKKQEGITLIALIITIVVLLILAGVAIGTLEESNIIGRSKEASSKYETEKENENALIKDFEELLSNYENSKELNIWEERGLTLETIQYDKKYIGTLKNSDGDELNVEFTIESSGGGVTKYSPVNGGYSGEGAFTSEQITQGKNEGNIVITSNSLEMLSIQFNVIFNADGESANISMIYNETIFSGNIIAKK